MVQKINFNNITGNPLWSKVSANSTLDVGYRYIVDCSSGNTVLALPSTPRVGDEVRVIDFKGAANTTNLIVMERNGNMIEGETANAVIDVARAGFGFVYTGSEQGWVLIEV